MLFYLLLSDKEWFLEEGVVGGMLLLLLLIFVRESFLIYIKYRLYRVYDIIKFILKYVY